MNYILAEHVGYELNTNFSLAPNVWYKAIGEASPCVFLFENSLPIVVDFKNKNTAGVISFSYKANNYFILKPQPIQNASVATISYQNKTVQVTVSHNLQICIDGNCVLNCPVGGIEYSQYQTIKNHLIIYFTGKRNYFVIIKDGEVLACDYYDELNVEKEEIYFLKRLNDSINHGKVYCITSAFDSYLVYLDDYDLNLKDNFLPAVFLDCVLAKNYNYANGLLTETLRPKKASDIEGFFEDFTCFVTLSECEFALLKNDTFVGIVNFEISGGKVANIIFV